MNEKTASCLASRVAAMAAGGASRSRPYGILKACTCWPERLEPDLRSGDLETAFHRSERPSMVSAWLRCKETALKRPSASSFRPLRKDARIPSTSPLLLARCLDRNAGVLNPAGAHKKRSRHSTMASHIPCSVHPILALILLRRICGSTLCQRADSHQAGHEWCGFHPQ
jgi:hypothetical protein